MDKESMYCHVFLLVEYNEGDYFYVTVTCLIGKFFKKKGLFEFQGRFLCPY